MVLILLGNLAHSLKFEAFEIISRKSLLVLPQWNMIPVNFFCCLARHCNYHGEKLRDVNFKSGLYCMRHNIVFKAPGRLFEGGGGTLGIFGWGCATGTLEPLAYTRARSSEFCYPILD